MKMALDNAGAINIVRRYDPGHVTIRDQTFSRSLIVFGNSLIPDWAPTSVATLDHQQFEPLGAPDLEVLILGTGEQQLFPDPAVFVPLMERGIGFEVMDNAAACRTYNILLAEQRRVALALLIAPPAP
jgi:uncharacterized protein